MMIRKLIFCVLFSLFFIGGWLTFNPENGFGISFYAITTFNKILYFYSDIEVGISGKVSLVKKTHLIELSDLKQLLSENPDILIISKGWDGSIMKVKGVRSNDKYKVIIKNNNEAKKLYNKLKREGKKVAIRFHSTC